MISRFVARYAQRHFVLLLFIGFLGYVRLLLLSVVLVAIWKQLICGGLRYVIWFSLMWLRFALVAVRFNSVWFGFFARGFPPLLPLSSFLSLSFVLCSTFSPIIVKFLSISIYLPNFIYIFRFVHLFRLDPRRVRFCKKSKRKRGVNKLIIVYG